MWKGHGKGKTLCHCVRQHRIPLLQTGGFNTWQQNEKWIENINIDVEHKFWHSRKSTGVTSNTSFMYAKPALDCNNLITEYKPVFCKISMENQKFHNDFQWIPPLLKCVDFCDKAVLTKDIHRTVTHVRLIVGQLGILFRYFWKVLIETSRHLTGIQYVARANLNKSV